MIKKIRVRYFKKHEDEEFDLSGNVILAGPNNSGKSTILQAIAAWNLAREKWLTDRGTESGSKAKRRTGVPVTRKDFAAVPLREMNLLWTNRSTSYRKSESDGGHKPGRPKHIEIEITGERGNEEWTLSFEFTYGNTEFVYIKPGGNAADVHEMVERSRETSIVHVPAFSGIGIEEAIYTKPYQDYFIGQNKPGDVLRNQLVTVYDDGKDAGKWNELCGIIDEIFKIRLLPPKHHGLPFIVCEYHEKENDTGRNDKGLDIASAGSGFLQVLMLFGFLFSRPSTILLFDEPDAHLHVILQKQVYDRLKEICRKRQSQLVISTHSEVIVDNTDPEGILSLYRKPHRLFHTEERDRLREALKRLRSMDILEAERSSGILYVEGSSDYDLLRVWAGILNHGAKELFEKGVFWNPMNGSNPGEARSHFFALKEIRPDIRGIILLDGDNRKLPDRELSAGNLFILRWKRYEVENYLVHPEVLSRFVAGENPDLFTANAVEKGMRFLKGELPPAVMQRPLDEHDYLDVTAASKKILPEFLYESGVYLPKKEYYQIASFMKPDEIHPEIIEKLDTILGIFSAARE